MALTLRGVIVLLTGVVLGLGLALSSTVWNALTARGKAVAAPLDPTIESAALVAEVIDRVRREYVDSVDDKRIVEAAIRGIVADLDQHSTFLDAEQYEDIRISTTGNYTGVGLDVNLEGGKVTVVAPLEGAPAERAGILPGDVVSAVDDVPVDAAHLLQLAPALASLDVPRHIDVAGADLANGHLLARLVRDVQYLGDASRQCH